MDARTKYTKALEEARTTVHDLLVGAGEDKWKLVKKGTHGTVYNTKSPSFSGNVFKVVFEVDIGLEQAIECLYPAPRGFRQEWDPHLQRSEVLEDLDEDTWILLCVTKPTLSGLISGREFVDILGIKPIIKDKKVLCAGVTVDYPSVPKKHEIVRGHNYPCGTLWEVISGKKVRVSVMYHSDIGGRVPRRLVETTMPTVMLKDLDCLFSHLESRR